MALKPATNRSTYGRYGIVIARRFDGTARRYHVVLESYRDRHGRRLATLLSEKPRNSGCTAGPFVRLPDAWAPPLGNQKGL